MITIPGYTITEKIYENLKTAVYRAKKQQEQQEYIIKILRSDYPTPQELARLSHEYRITKDLNLPGVVKAYGLEKCDNSLALILEDFGGKSLRDFLIYTKLNLVNILEICIKITEVIGSLHNHNIIHKDIKPENIIVNVEKHLVKIADFSIATSLAKESQNINNPNLIQGTLAYMSPEQTGRMNRSIDYRTDFYSLGVTLYEMLTGELPFTSVDPMEMVHCHIAKKPLPPQQLNREIPFAISDIVMKLLAKTAEDRYQSAYGIKVDLEFCLNQLQTTGKIDHFTVGQHDISAHFQIPQKLYGREQEIEKLMAAFEQVSHGITQIMLVGGYSGIGKSALVNEIHKPIVGKKGYFIAGKFDQFKRNVPYASLIQAFQELIRQLLTESEAQIQTWQQKLINTLGTNAQVIIDVIPEVELIIGAQAPVPQLAAAEAQNRFNLVFQQFLNVFAQKEHPLVLFLDDLQWADSASLKLLQLLMTSSDSQCLLLIGAYRDNEVSPTHPFMLTLEEIQKSEAIINSLSLAPLGISEINQLIADTLHCTTNKANTLAQLLLEKTNGNPFFLTQMLTTLHQEQLLSYNAVAGCWQWDIEQIQSLGITDNVVELMIGKIQKLSVETQNTLKLAACIGNTFSLNLLSIVSEKALSATAKELWEALEVGLIIPLSDAYKIPLVDELETSLSFKAEDLVITYRFLHDRVQQAAYSLIPEAHKKETHLKVGRLLLNHTRQAEVEEKIFDIVNHLNIGAELVNCQLEKNKIAQLNLIAGRKAKASTAYETARRYLTSAIGMLAENSWQTHYELTLDIFVEAVEVQYLNTNFELAQQLSEVVLQNAQDVLQKVKVYETKLYFYIAQNQMLEAIGAGLQVLDMLGVSLSQEPPEVSVIEDLINLPDMNDAYKLAAMRILITLVTPGLNAKPDLLPLFAFTLVNLSIKYGNSAFASHGYAFYGMILCGGLQKIDEGYRFGQLSLKVLDRYSVKELEPKVSNMFNAFIRHWKEPVQKAIEPLLAAMQVAVETGDLEYASYNAATSCHYMFFAGMPLKEVDTKLENHIDFIVNFKQEFQVYFAQIMRQLVLNLLDESEHKLLLVGKSFDEQKMIPVFMEMGIGIMIFMFYLTKTILYYLFKDYKQAAISAINAEKYQGSMVGFMHLGEYNFYHSLALLSVYTETEEVEAKKQILDKVEANQQKLNEWAEHSPANYRHKCDLVAAEKARALGKELAATRLYERAIKGAKEQGFIQEEALANELAADFYFCGSLDKIAQMYLAEAYYAYMHWGAKAKAKDLESKYPFLARNQNFNSINITGKYAESTTSTLTGNVNALDLTTIIKASQAIAGEIVFSKLLDKLLRIVMENAGAETSCLLLEKNDQLVIEATGAIENEQITLCEPIPLTDSQELPLSLINYVFRTQQYVVLNDASQEGKFARDAYLIRTKPKSILCMPILNQGKLIGILYLENNLTTGAFTTERLEVLRLLSSQAAISLDNALLYSDLEAATQKLKQANNQLEEYSRTLEQKVEDRTLELQEKNVRLKEQAKQLELTLQELKATQGQMIQKEKMSSLGQLVAGIAHEINNPINFIYGNITHVNEYTENLLHLINIYQQESPTLTPQMLADREDIDLEFLLEDLPKLLSSMKVGSNRIREIVLSLRNFSRLDEAEMKPVNVHEGIDSTLLILQHRLKGTKSDRSSIEIIKNYASLPLVNCYAGQLNQVFMNLLANAIDALEEYSSQLSANSEAHQSQITITTELVEQEQVVIRIADNGPGMSAECLSQIFNPFFTTKPVGKGTGLGLSISYQIVVDKHGGQLSCNSQLGQGTELIVEIPVKQTSQQSKLIINS